MSTKENINKKKDIIFVVLFIFFGLCIVLFNYIVDPYYILKDSVIKGFNDVKTHKYTNKRTIIYSDIKLNSKNKDTAFTGNCILSHYGKGLDNVAFFTIPVVKLEEVGEIIKTIHNIAPEIKTIYWGMFYDDFLNENNDKINNYLPEENKNNFGVKDFINLFFSYNTTKYSIETVIDSIKNRNKNDILIYPYREIAKKNYDEEFSYDELDKIQKLKEYTDSNNIKLILYYSPIHMTKKVHIYEKNKWDANKEIKRRLAAIMPYYDYSLVNEYNTAPLDENSQYFIDNVHPTVEYNNIIVNDLLSDKKAIGVLITADNVEKYLSDDSNDIEIFIKEHKNLADKLKNVKPEEANVSLIKKTNI